MTSRENQELVSKFAGGQVLFCATIDVIELYNFGVFSSRVHCVTLPEHGQLSELC